ncbi:MAG TPA: peptidyl-prolyl cis-trans isomerase [Terriglobales bacterium]|nr:peptidyl-prolyl cis-trans isomerase [Terriglobales bacterium]
MIKFLQTPTLTKKIVLGAILVFVSVMMVITLVPGIFDSLAGTPGQNVYAKVAGHEISNQEVDQQAQQMAKSRGFPAEFVQFLRAQAGNQLVTRYALVAEAERMGLTASDQELSDYLHQGQFGAMLFPGGQFIGDDRYAGFTSDYFHMSIAQFEQMVKEQLLIDKLIGMVQGTITVPEQQVKDNYLKENRKVKFSYAVLSTDQIMKQVKVTDAELKAYYDQHKQELVNSIPAKRKAQYVVISSSNVSGVTVSDDDLKNYYNQHIDQYKVPERVHVRHILIKTPTPGPDGKVDQKAVDAAKAKAEDILKQLQNGANFEELAKKDSEDPGSAAKGGDLGWFQHGAMVPEFDKTAFGLQKEGQLSGLVKSNYGFHIIQLLGKQPAHTRSFEEVKSEIGPVVKQQKDAQAASTLATDVEVKAKVDGLAKAAAAHNLKVETSDWFSNTGSLPGMGNAPEFMRVAFSMQPNSAPQVAQIPNGYAILQVTANKPAATPTFEEAKDRLEKEFRTEQANSLLDKKTQELSERAKALHDLKKAAAEQGAQFKTSDLVTQKDQVPQIGALSGQAASIFSLSKDQISGPIMTDQNGIVAQILDQQEPSTEEFAKNKDAAREKVLDQERNQAVQLYAQNLVQNMEKNGKIRISKSQQPLGGLNPQGQ